MSISKMNKPELYELCKKQQDELTKLNFLNGCLVEEKDTCEKFLQEKVDEVRDYQVDRLEKLKEIKKLKDENEKLKEYVPFKNINNDRSKEVKILKEMKYNLENKCIKLMDDMNCLKQENEKLKKENKELEEYIPFEKECNDKCKEIQRLKNSQRKCIKLMDDMNQDIKKYQKIVGGLYL